MASPQFTKSPPELVARFDGAAARHPAAERRKMFGYPALFVGGNLATGLFADTWMVRLGPADLEALVAMPGAGPFTPMPGRTMKGYATLSPTTPRSTPGSIVQSPSRGPCRPRSRASRSVARAGRAAPGIGICAKAVSCFDAPTLGDA